MVSITAAEFRRIGKSRRPKYGNRKKRGFASGREADHAADLALLAKTGKITGLRYQVEFPLVVNRVLVARYVCDFLYCRDGQEICEDAKGVRTRDYVMKKKLMLAIYGIEIVEV